MHKGYGKTLENRLKKSGNLICLPKTEKRLQFTESAAGNPLDNVKSKHKIVDQGCEAVFRIETPQAAWVEAEEKSSQVIFLILSTKKSDKTPGKLTFLASPLVNKENFLLPT